MLDVLREIQTDFNGSSRRSRISLADLIVLAGAAGIERAAGEAGQAVVVPFVPGRTDATPEQTDVPSFALLEPTADAFRNYFDVSRSYRSPTEMLVDKADQLNLSIPEMTALIGGMRVLDANWDGNANGVLSLIHI